MKTTKKYILYYRVSTKRQGESGLGLEAQRQILGHYIKSSEVVRTFTENATAKSYSCKVRPLLCEAIDLCVKHGYTLAVAKVDRLSRNSKDALTIYDDLKGRIFSCDIPATDGKMDTFMFQMFMAFAEREREIISLRTTNAMQVLRKTRKEWRVPNPNLSAAREKSVITLRQDREGNEFNIRASAIIQAYRAQGKTLKEIAKLLTDKKFLTANGKKSGEWHITQVARLCQ